MLKTQTVWEKLTQAQLMMKNSILAHKMVAYDRWKQKRNSNVQNSGSLFSIKDEPAYYVIPRDKLLISEANELNRICFFHNCIYITKFGYTLSGFGGGRGGGLWVCHRTWQIWRSQPCGGRPDWRWCLSKPLPVGASLLLNVRECVRRTGTIIPLGACVLLELWCPYSR